HGPPPGGGGKHWPVERSTGIDLIPTALRSKMQLAAKEYGSPGRGESAAVHVVFIKQVQGAAEDADIAETFLHLEIEQVVVAYVPGDGRRGLGKIDAAVDVVIRGIQFHAERQEIIDLGGDAMAGPVLQVMVGHASRQVPGVHERVTGPDLQVPQRRDL